MTLLTNKGVIALGVELGVASMQPMGVWAGAYATKGLGSVTQPRHSLGQHL